MKYFTKSDLQVINNMGINILENPEKITKQLSLDYLKTLEKIVNKYDKNSKINLVTFNEYWDKKNKYFTEGDAIDIKYLGYDLLKHWDLYSCDLELELHYIELLEKLILATSK